jgi:very-short-patch-repair endonuclease
LGPYVVDFVCQQAKLVIEVDGSQHGDKAISRRDADRTRWLEAEGYRIVRFWNSDVSENLNGVLEVIFTALQQPSHLGGGVDHPTPARFARQPSPSRGG